MVMVCLFCGFSVFYFLGFGRVLGDTFDVRVESVELLAR